MRSWFYSRFNWGLNMATSWKSNMEISPTLEASEAPNKVVDAGEPERQGLIWWEGDFSMTVGFKKENSCFMLSLV